MRQNLTAHHVQPTVNADIGWQLEGRSGQFARHGDVRQAGEEINAAGKVVDGQARERLQQDTARNLRRHKHPKRAKFAERKADGEARQTSKGIPCLYPDKEDAVGNHRIGIKHANLVTIGIHLDNAANQRALNLATKDIARNRDPERFNPDYWIITRNQCAHVDLDASDRAFEFQAGVALQAGDGR